MAKRKLLMRSTNDCGIACMAMFLDETYANVRREVMRYFKNVKRIPFCGMDEDDDRYIAARFGEKVKLWRVGDKTRQAVIQRLQGRRAIICVPGWGYKPDSPEFAWHAVYWDGRQVHDPCPEGGYPKNGAKVFDSMIMAIVLHSETEYTAIETC